MVKSFLPYHGFDLTLSFIERLLCAACRKFVLCAESLKHLMKEFFMFPDYWLS